MTDTEKRALLMTILSRLEKGKRLECETHDSYHVVLWDHVESVLIDLSREKEDTP